MKKYKYMKMKCIGGEADDQYHEVDMNLYRVNDAIKIMKAPIFNPTISNLIDYYIYRIAVFHFSKDDKYYFLVPEGQTDKEAILYQFSK
jgi:hypothetical protein